MNSYSKRVTIYFILGLCVCFLLCIFVLYVKKSSADNEELLSSREASSYTDEIYNTFYTALSAHEDSITFINTPAKDGELNEQYARVLADHPEFFWLTGGGYYQATNINQLSYCKFYPEIEGELYDILAMESILNYSVEKVVAAANELETDYEKALYVHDLLIRNCQYDMNAYQLISSTGSAIGSNYAATAYGCLVNRKAVCEGYAKAYQLIMTELGIECGYVSGSAVNSAGVPEGHGWNYIKLNDTYYYVDVTWDDPLSPDGTSNSIRWDYFCISSAEFMKNHTLGEGQFTPVP